MIWSSCLVAEILPSGSVLALTVLGQFFLGYSVPSQYVDSFVSETSWSRSSWNVYEQLCLFVCLSYSSPFCICCWPWLSSITPVCSLFRWTPFPFHFMCFYSMSLCFVPYHAFCSVSSPFCSFFVSPSFRFVFSFHFFLSCASRSLLFSLSSPYLSREFLLFCSELLLHGFLFSVLQKILLPFICSVAAFSRV